MEQSEKQSSSMVTHRKVSTVAGELFVYEQGGGDRAVVLWPAIFTDASIYTDLTRSLADRYRVITIDGPGHGRSGPPKESRSMADHGAAMLQVMDECRVQRGSLIGTSWGGLVAGEAALAAPHRVEAVVFMNTPFFVNERGPGLANRAIVMGARLFARSSFFADGVARSFFTPDTIKGNGEMYQAFRAHLKAADRRALAASVRAVLLDREPLAPRLAAIHAPALVVAGTHDLMYPLEQMRRAAASLPQGSFEEIDANHIAPVDAPQAVNALVSRFLPGFPADRR